MNYQDIKFKVWDGERLTHVNSIGWTDGEIDWIDTPKYSGPIQEDMKIFQYTGLKDKSSKNIYGNGYILKVQSPKGPFLAKVIYELGTYGLIVLNGKVIDYFPDHWNDHFIPLLDIYWNNNNDDQVIESAEIIGNIYENPEILEEINK